tara:strand:- start:38104 stop:38484 length:381 start_codon:yes stop_codon:yes gene_type:complete
MSYNFLVIDDEPELVEYMQSLLEDEYPGCMVHALDDCEEAIAYCRANVYDIIYTDFKMPKMNGDQLIKGIRELNNDNQSAGVIVLTAHGESARIAFDNLDNVIILEKPLDIEVNRKKVRILLSLRN